VTGPRGGVFSSVGDRDVGDAGYRGVRDAGYRGVRDAGYRQILAPVLETPPLGPQRDSSPIF